MEDIIVESGKVSTPDTGRTKSLWSSIGPEFTGYCVTLLLSCFFTAIILNIWNTNIGIPFKYSGDVAFNLAFIKSIVDNGWYQENPFLGAPYGYNLYDYPMGADNFHHLFFKFLSFFTDNPALILNLYFLFTFPLVALFSFFVFRRVKLSISVSVLLSLLYTFMPYHFMRGANHMFLSAYYMVPLAIFLGLYILSGKQVFFKSVPGIKLDFSRVTLFAVVVCVLIASSGIYYAFFTCLAFSILGITVALKKKSFPVFLRVATFCGIILILVFINLLPNIIYKIENGKNPAVALRHPGESEVYGLKIAQLLLPVNGHRLSTFARLKQRYNEVVLVTENETATLGLLAGAGFLFLIACVFYRQKGDDLLSNLVSFNIIAVLFSTVGGVGMIFSLVIMPEIRSQNRISIFIAFIALLSLGLLLESLFKFIKRKEIKISIVTALLGLGIWDQTTEGFVVNQEGIKKEYNLHKKFIASIESSTPEGAPVLQLPFYPYIESGPIYAMWEYDHLKPYLHSKKLKWSYGLPKGREGEIWLKSVSALNPAFMVYSVYKAGFKGVYIDRFGYEDKAANLEAGLKEVLKVEPVISDDGRLAFFNFNNYNGKLELEDDYNTTFAEFNSENIGGISNRYAMEGWSGSEEGFRWTEGNTAKILLPFNKCKSDLILTIRLFPLVKPGTLNHQTIYLQLAGQKLTSWIVDKEDEYQVKISQELLKENDPILEFILPDATSPASLGINNDARILGIAVKSVKVSEYNPEERGGISSNDK